MATTDQLSFEVELIKDPGTHRFEAPTKKINDGDDLAFFFTSRAYSDLTKWLLQLNRAMFPSRHDDEQITVYTLDNLPHLSESVQNIQRLLSALSSLIEKAPPDTGPRRFGNVAFRVWYRLAEESTADLIREHLGDAFQQSSDQSNLLTDELKAYLTGAFGSSQRLDYGTGHELSFAAFLGALWKLGFFKRGEECAIVLGIIQPYLELVRKLIGTYTLEPAGSHGVWGLDDHSFVPYIFGSAQLGPAIKANDHSISVPTEGSLKGTPSPSSVTDKALVTEQKNSNMYFSAIQFIYDVKKGPFWEHSPVLYDISGIKDGWGKINKGMLKMYVAEVLGKFPVVQHFPFGSLFKWEQDGSATHRPPTIHSRQQPVAMQSKDVPPVGTGGTSAPWPRTGSTALPQVQANTGMPSTRAPWAASARPAGAEGSGVDSQRRPLAPRMGPPPAAMLRKKDPPV